MTKQPLPRLFITVTPEFDEKFSSWAERLGVSKSQFGNMCLQAGLNSLIRAVAPEEAYSPEVIIRILEEARKQGFQMDFSDLNLKRKDD